MVHKRTRIGVAALGLFALAVCGTPSRALIVEPYTLGETVHDASAIVVGRIVSHQCRWGNNAHRWILTDYKFQVDDVVLAAPGVQRGGALTLTFWGGRIEDEVQSIGGFHNPQDGERLAVMLRPDWQTPGFTPCVAFTNGLFHIRGEGGQAAVLDGDGADLIWKDATHPARNFEAVGPGTATVGVTLDAFVRALRTNLPAMKAGPAKAFYGLDPTDPAVIPTPASVTDQEAGDIPAMIGIENPLFYGGDDLKTPALGQPEDISQDAIARIAGGVGTEWSRFNTWGSVPIVLNSFPDSFAPWFPEDQYQMSKWNYYADVYRVRNPRTGTYGWGNDRNDFAGWLTDAQLNATYGSTWNGAWAITFTRSSFFTGRIIEADVAFNQALGWTLDEVAIYLSTTSAKPYRQSLAHELGHVWGLDHNFNFMSIMNYSPTWCRAYSFPCMDDAEAIRAAYGGQAQARTDLGCYLFYSNGFQNYSDATYPGTVVAGNNMFVNNFHIENVGTTTIASPTIEFYLSANLDYNGYYRYLNTVSYSPALNRFGWYNPASVGVNVPVPTNMPGGDYYLGSFIRNDGGPGQGAFPYSNNYGWTRSRIRVYPRVTGLSVSPGTVNGGSSATGTVYLGSAAGPGGLTVSLSSNIPSVASVPGSVYVPYGSSTATFGVSTAQPYGTTVVTLTASSNGVSQTAALRVNANTVLIVPNLAGGIGDTVHLTATLRRLVDSAGLSGRTVHFTFNGRNLNGTTNASGVATVDVQITEDMGLGDRAVTANFDGDSSYVGSSGRGLLTISQGATRLTGNDVSGLPGNTVTIKAVLARTGDGQGLDGRTVSFVVDGVDLGTAVTGADGTVSMDYGIPADAAPGARLVSVAFNGDALYLLSGLSLNLNVQATTLIVAQDASGAVGDTVNLTATLLDSAGNPVVSATLLFSIDGVFAGAASTDDSGTAALSMTLADLLAGDHTITVDFAGDALHTSSQGTATLTVTGG